MRCFDNILKVDACSNDVDAQQDSNYKAKNTCIFTVAGICMHSMSIFIKKNTILFVFCMT